MVIYEGIKPRTKTALQLRMYSEEVLSWIKEDQNYSSDTFLHKQTDENTCSSQSDNNLLCVEDTQSAIPSSSNEQIPRLFPPTGSPDGPEWLSHLHSSNSNPLVTEVEVSRSATPVDIT